MCFLYLPSRGSYKNKKRQGNDWALVKVLIAQSCLTLCDHMGCSWPGSFVQGILQASRLEWIAFPPTRGSSQPRDWTRVFYMQTDSLPLSQQRSSKVKAKVSQLCPTLCDPKDCSTPGFPVHHLLMKIAQTHVCQVGDVIQPSHPLLSPSPPAFNLFQWVCSSHQVAKVLEFQLQHLFFQWIFRTDFL